MSDSPHDGKDIRAARLKKTWNHIKCLSPMYEGGVEEVEDQTKHELLPRSAEHVSNESKHALDLLP